MNGRVEWCGRGDSNPYALAGASPSSVSGVKPGESSWDSPGFSVPPGDSRPLQDPPGPAIVAQEVAHGGAIRRPRRVVRDGCCHVRLARPFCPAAAPPGVHRGSCASDGRLPATAAGVRPAGSSPAKTDSGAFVATELSAKAIRQRASSGNLRTKPFHASASP